MLPESRHSICAYIWRVATVSLVCIRRVNTHLTESTRRADAVSLSMHSDNGHSYHWMHWESRPVTLHALVKWTHLSPCLRTIDTVLTACIVRVDTVTLHAFREWRQSYCMRLDSGKSNCMRCRQWTLSYCMHSQNRHSFSALIQRDDTVSFRSLSLKTAEFFNEQ